MGIFHAICNIRLPMLLCSISSCHLIGKSMHQLMEEGNVVFITMVIAFRFLKIQVQIFVNLMLWLRTVNLLIVTLQVVWMILTLFVALHKFLDFSYWNDISLSRYYYNKKTKQSSWEKPLELMTPLEVNRKCHFFNHLLFVPIMLKKRLP